MLIHERVLGVSYAQSRWQIPVLPNFWDPIYANTVACRMTNFCRIIHLGSNMPSQPWGAGAGAPPLWVAGHLELSAKFVKIALSYKKSQF